MGVGKSTELKFWVTDEIASQSQEVRLSPSESEYVTRSFQQQMLSHLVKLWLRMKFMSS